MAAPDDDSDLTADARSVYRVVYPDPRNRLSGASIVLFRTARDAATFAERNSGTTSPIQIPIQEYKSLLAKGAIL